MVIKEMKKCVMIVLTGGRSTPAILGVLAARPTNVELINSVDEPARANDVVNALKGIPDLSINGLDRMVDAYNKEQVYKLCTQIAEKYKHDDLFINLSAGTKIMALGAYQFALEKKKTAIYVVTNQNNILNLTTTEKMDFPVLDVDGYFACYRRSAEPTFNMDKLSIPSDELIKLATYFAKTEQPALKILEQIRKHGQGREKRTCLIPSNANDQEKQVWEELKRVGILGNVEFVSGGIHFEILSDNDFEFLKGTWLEIFVWDQARQLRTEKNVSFFSDVKFSLEIPSDVTDAKKEIDAAMIYQGQLLHCSCKAGSSKPWSTSYLDELSAVSSLVGGKFCGRIFITTQYAPTEGSGEDQGYRLFCKQAEDRQIVVVTGNQLHEIDKILKKQATDPSYPRT